MTTYSWFGGSLGLAYDGRYEVGSDWINQTTGVRDNGFPQPGDTAEIDATVTQTVQTIGVYFQVPAIGPEVLLFAQQSANVLADDPEATVGWTITGQTIDLNGGPGFISMWLENSALTDDTLSATGTVLLANYLDNTVSGTLAVGTSTDTAFVQAILYGFDTANNGPVDQASQDTFNADTTIGAGSEFDIEAYPNPTDPAHFVNNGAISVQPGGTLVIDDTDGSGPNATGGHTSLAINDGTIAVHGAAGGTTAATLDINTQGSGTITVDGQGALPANTSLLIEGSVQGQTITASDATVRIDDISAAISNPDVAGYTISGGAFVFGDNHAVLQLHQPPLTTLQLVDGALMQEPDGQTPFTTPIIGFRAGDTIDLVGQNTGGTYDTAYDPATGVLQVESPASTAGHPPEIIAALTLVGTYNPDLFQLASNASTQDLDLLYAGKPAPCFVAGSRIATPRGDVAVEALRVGDLVRTVLDEGAEPVIWVGRREVACDCHPKPKQVWPVRVAAAAFGPGRPYTELFLSPDHAVYVNEVLIPIRFLINGSTITQVPVRKVTYHHIELPRHHVVLAQGLPAESFLDLRDGSNYANRPGPVRLYPDFTVRMWEAFGCARLIVTGPELEAARRMVNSRAAAVARAAGAA